MSGHGGERAVGAGATWSWQQKAEGPGAGAQGESKPAAGEWKITPRPSRATFISMLACLLRAGGVLRCWGPFCTSWLGWDPQPLLLAGSAGHGVSSSPCAVVPKGCKGRVGCSRAAHQGWCGDLCPHAGLWWGCFHAALCPPVLTVCFSVSPWQEEIADGRREAEVGLTPTPLPCPGDQSPSKRLCPCPQ